MSIRMVNTPAVRARRWIAACLLTVVAVVVAPQAFAQEAEAGAAPTASTYVVASGETLWQIASTVTPAGGSVRDTVATIKSMNLLESADIAPGDQLLIPTVG